MLYNFGDPLNIIVQVFVKWRVMFLAIPTTTLAFEYAFSSGSRVLDQYQSSLISDTIEALICGRD